MDGMSIEEYYDAVIDEVLAEGRCYTNIFKEECVDQVVGKLGYAPSLVSVVLADAAAMRAEEELRALWVSGDGDMMHVAAGEKWQEDQPSFFDVLKAFGEACKVRGARVFDEGFEVEGFGVVAPGVRVGGKKPKVKEGSKPEPHEGVSSRVEDGGSLIDGENSDSSGGGVSLSAEADVLSVRMNEALARLSVETGALEEGRSYRGESDTGRAFLAGLLRQTSKDAGNIAAKLQEIVQAAGEVKKGVAFAPTDTEGGEGKERGSRVHCVHEYEGKAAVCVKCGKISRTKRNVATIGCLEDLTGTNYGEVYSHGHTFEKVVSFAKNYDLFGPVDVVQVIGGGTLRELSHPSCVNQLKQGFNIVPLHDCQKKEFAYQLHVDSPGVMTEVFVPRGLRVRPSNGGEIKFYSGSSFGVVVMWLRGTLHVEKETAGQLLPNGPALLVRVLDWAESERWTIKHFFAKDKTFRNLLDQDDPALVYFGRRMKEKSWGDVINLENDDDQLTESALKAVFDPEEKGFGGTKVYKLEGERKCRAISAAWGSVFKVVTGVCKIGPVKCVEGMLCAIPPSRYYALLTSADSFLALKQGVDNYALDDGGSSCDISPYESASE